MSYIDDLRIAIRRLHGVEAKHIESVSVRELAQGKLLWEGIVEIFEISGHPKASKVYAWTRDGGNPKSPKRHMTVLHIAPVTSPGAAVRARIIQEFGNLEPREKAQQGRTPNATKR